MKTLFPAEVPTLGIAGQDTLWPVHRIYCVGKNYADHVREMGDDPGRQPPVFFSKPNDAIAHRMAEIPFPSRTDNLHYEAELVVAIGGEAWQLDAQKAREVVFGYAVGIDLTRRDLQAEARDGGRPWDVAKGFDLSAPISAIVPVSDCGWLDAGAISLALNGELRQQGNISDMIWGVEEIIAELSTYFRLRPGDLIFTGTPAGVGRVEPGDTLKATIEGLGDLTVKLA